MKQGAIMKFVEAINHQNLPLITDMMSEEFYFIDTFGINEKYREFPTKVSCVSFRK